MNLTPWNQNNSQPSENGTANALKAAAERSPIVSTAAPVNGFERRTKAQNEAYKKELEQRKEETKNFKDYVKMNLGWQDEDLKCTETMSHWQVETVANLGKHALIAAKGASKKALIGARIGSRLGLIQSATASQIAEIERQTQEKSRELLGRRR